MVVRSERGGTAINRPLLVVCGFIAAVAGLAGAGTLLFGPTGSWGSAKTDPPASFLVREQGTTSVLGEGVRFAVLALLLVSVLTALLVGLGAYRQGAPAERGSASVVAPPALLVVVATAVTLFSLVPVALLGLATTLLTAVIAGRERPTSRAAERAV